MDADIWGDDDETKTGSAAAVLEPKDDYNPFVSDMPSAPSATDLGDDLPSPPHYTTLNQGRPTLSKESHLSTASSPDQSDITSYAQSTKSDTSSDAVRIVATEERKAKLTKYTVYIIESGNHSVARRYNDFKWLYSALGAEFLFSIPSLPPSHSIKRFKEEVVAQRRYDLERFLNRIHENEFLRGSSATESFLCQNDEQSFEDEKKRYKKAVQDRSAHDTLCLLLKCFPNLENETIPEHLLGAQTDEGDEDVTHLLTISSMPRIREFFMRCDERLEALNKMAASLFKVFANISDELNVLNQFLSDLYDGESMDRPQCMSSCTERIDIRQFQEEWRHSVHLQANSFYKYFLLRLRYEHEDIKAVLDSFKRYDSVHEKYKKHKSALKKLKEKSPEKDASVLEKQLEESRHLLLVLCKVILLQQTPASWHHRITHYNQAVRCYAQTVTMTPTM